MIFEAEISNCGNYRYSLTREWDDTKPKVLFVMLNPSTACDESNDLTTIRCINYARRWGYEKLTDEIYDKFLHKMTYKDIDEKHKIKVFDIAKDNEAIEQIKQRVNQCQDYINQLNY